MLLEEFNDAAWFRQQVNGERPSLNGVPLLLAA